jgi:hypothetical protein
VNKDRRGNVVGHEHRLVPVIQVVAGRSTKSTDSLCVRLNAGRAVDEHVPLIAPQ